MFTAPVTHVAFHPPHWLCLPCEVRWVGLADVCWSCGERGESVRRNWVQQCSVSTDGTPPPL